MLKAIQPSTALPSEEASNSVPQNPAILHCVAVWKSTRQQSLANGRSEFYSGVDAAKAYCAVMPQLSGYQNICDYIACVGFGLVIDIIKEDRADKLLHAAQVALKAVSQLPKSQKGGAL
ncbi:MAG TPA: hypothetical protein VN776_15300 [Terracidiphilus sp.]|nr:hypothetical protein [Terracidiphilus sp.]